MAATTFYVLRRSLFVIFLYLTLLQLLNIVGQVEILKPEWSDFGYDMQIALHIDLVEHIIEAYNFDKNFTGEDISKVLSEFRQSGFRIK